MCVCVHTTTVAISALGRMAAVRYVTRKDVAAKGDPRTRASENGRKGFLGGIINDKLYKEIERVENQVRRVGF